MEFTTIEKLQMKVSATYGVVLQYGERVFVADTSWKGYYAEIYEFVETPEETGLSAIECRLNLVKHIEGDFPDSGHAIVECVAQCN